MTDQKHTKEPWRVSNNELGFADFDILTEKHVGYPNVGIARLVDECFSDYKLGSVALHIEEVRANGKRIVECVNACAGIENPKDFIAQLDAVTKQRDELREFVIVLKRIVEPNVSKGLADDIDTAIARAKTKESV